MLWGFIALLLGLLIGGFYASIKLLTLMVAFLSQHFQLQVIALSPGDVLVILLNMDLLLTGLILLPMILIVAASYIRPALYTNERRFLRYIPLIYILSMAGLAAGWFLSIDMFIPYFMNFSQIIGVTNNWSLANLLQFIMTICATFMVIFNTPLLFVTLFHLELLKLQDINLIRKFVLVIAFVFGAIFSPPDIASQCVVSLPIYLFFEITAQYCLLKDRFKKKSIPSDDK